MLSKFSLALLAAATTTFAAPIEDVFNAVNTTEGAAAATTFLNAIGMGVANRGIATGFYQKVFGIRKQSSMPVANMGQGGWTEDIDVFSGAHSSALVFMEWTDKRPYKDLPIKLTLAVENPKAKVDQVAASGGKALPEMKTQSNPTALYAKDPNGYLLELVPGTGATALKTVAVGVTDLQKSADWWAGATGMTKGEMQKFPEWDSISLKAEKASELVFMDWHETPKRVTKNMPIKLVFKASSTSGFAKAIQSQNPKGSVAGAMSMFQWEPIEHTLIEIN